MNKLKALVFYQYLSPWRIDVFNEMGKYYDMTIAFTDADTVRDSPITGKNCWKNREY